MPLPVPHIEIPRSDLWTALFERKDRLFPDSQPIYTSPLPPYRTHTFTSLHSHASRFGSGLRSSPILNFKKGDVLAIFAHNHIDTPYVTWGTHWAGGVVSPANPAYGVRELAFHLRDSGARGLVTEWELLGVALEACREVGLGRERVLCLGDGEASLQGGNGEEVRTVESVLDDVVKGERVKLDCEKDLAFLVYSSGTTGLPKGVMLSHLNVVSEMYMLDFSEGQILDWKSDKILSVLPFYHIYGLQCLVHQPAFTGVSSVVMSSFDLKRFLGIIQDHKITYTYVAPPVVLHLAKNTAVEEYDLGSLRIITCGAAPLTKELIYAVREKIGTEVKQAYGLSETSPVTHIQKKWDVGLGSNGPPLPNQVVKFMSPDGEEVPVGMEGEVWIKGPNVFIGYLNNEAATLDCKTQDGFFKTGDIGYCDALNNMYITDRVKELIKYKGFQVAPAELEGILASHPLIDDVAVIGIQDESQATEVPMACIVLKKGVVADRGEEERIVEWLKGKVAGHKRLRGGVEWVDEVPKSASGKILRRVLKDRFGGRKIKAKL